MPITFVYCFAFVACLTPWVSSAGALLLGLVLSLVLQWPLPSRFPAYGKWLLQFSIVVLGFSMEPHAVLTAGYKGVFVTATSLVATLTLGYLLARSIRLSGKVPTLISVGTAICGGSAIAAVGPAIHADGEEMSVSLSVVFLLNAIALLVFPILGHWLHLSPSTFGSLAAIAIHDTSSVVGAATKFSDASVPVAVTIKLTRALWIIPLSVAFSWFYRRENGKGKSKFPYFILFFVLAVLFRFLLPQFETFYSACGHVGKAALKGAIFIASAQMTRAGLRRVGARPLVLAVSLWMLVIAGTLLAAKGGLLDVL